MDIAFLPPDDQLPSPPGCADPQKQSLQKTPLQKNPLKKEPLQARLDEMTKAAEGLLLGLACGDALGVPVETLKRGSFCVQGMQGFGTHGQPAGTWSDDTSMALCQALSLKPGGSELKVCARQLQDWLQRGFFTAGGAAFDAGPCTASAIARLPYVASPELAGGRETRDNGNACLVRTAPLVLSLLDTDSPAERFAAVRDACTITHGHPLSAACCFVLTEFERQLIQLKNAADAYQALRREFAGLRRQVPDYPWKLSAKSLGRVLSGDIRHEAECDIASGNYVVHTLEAALWCLLTSPTFSHAVLAAVNLGADADTTGALTGALAGLHYGSAEIPFYWLEGIARHKFIQQAAHKVAQMALGLRGAGCLEPGFA